jgi:hypothetical protein
MAEKTYQLYPEVRTTYADPADPEPSPETTLRGHLQLVATVQQAGLQPPPAWQELKTRLDELQAAIGDRPVITRLTTAVLDGGDARPIAELLAMAVSERSVDTKASIVEEIHASIHHRLRQLYGPGAQANYRALARQFDTAAKKFTHLAHAVELEGPADNVIGDRRRREAWEQAPAIANELTELVPALAAAALLCRPIDAPSRLGLDEATLQIPLTLDIVGCHSRTVWLSWHEQAETQPPTNALTMAHLTQPAIEHVQHRCGRWAGLVGSGATLAAHPNPAELELFPPPAHRYIIGADASGRRITPTVIDPEDKPGRRGVLRKLADTLASRQPTPEPDLLDTVAPDVDDTTDE